MPAPLLRIGTRGSPLALWQANTVRDGLVAALGGDPDTVEIVVIKTTGDVIQDRPLSEAGGKGLFVKEIDEALLGGRVDLAVHSAKDLPTDLAEGTGLAAVLPRADVRDALIGGSAATLDALPQGAVVGTASLRRGALVRRRRPDLKVVPFRGNVQTRLDKLSAGMVDATLLALAGLSRLGLAAHATEILPEDDFPPALGQGAVAVTARVGDERTREALGGLDCVATAAALACERAFLKILDGSCRTPIAGLARVEGDALAFRGLVLSEDGARTVEGEIRGGATDAERLGAEAGRDVRARTPADLLAAFG
ncbi:hydroxymethylbilane synthase [Chenggangzhangella methanolivorans]|uniref:Porphobilinogen deaminase n=1 Tax=Chenggangzhangella methanolivorans TaxID=1437009 RepID=A0A9E6R5R2_9HYPH|nr:hydroxymethylbilane synthase [Chenggangzhangella methanolivorans]QZN98344.1 hydroxymethylbilane synthase [Chenggangzhangella methanolivorans]